LLFKSLTKKVNDFLILKVLNRVLSPALVEDWRKVKNSFEPRKKKPSSLKIDVIQSVLSLGLESFGRSFWLAKVRVVQGRLIPEVLSQEV